MAVLNLKSFGGIAPIVPPRYLEETQAQTALNCPVFQGSIQSLSDLGGSVATLDKSGTIQSIYRFGQLYLTRDVTQNPPRPLASRRVDFPKQATTLQTSKTSKQAHKGEGSTIGST